MHTYILIVVHTYIIIKVHIDQTISINYIVKHDTLHNTYF